VDVVTYVFYFVQFSSYKWVNTLWFFFFYDARALLRVL